MRTGLSKIQPPTPILARDPSGRELHLEVTEDTVGAGLVVIRDDGMTRILSITAAFDLARQVCSHGHKAASA